MKRGRPRGSRKNLVALDYRSWLIEVDECFPSVNYIVRKKSDAHCAYCGSLEEALKMVYDLMLLDNVGQKNDYSKTIEDLRNIIVETKKEFASLLNADDLIKNSYKIVEKRTSQTEGDSSC